MEKKPINIERIIAIIGLILTLGVGGYMKSIWNDSIQTAMVEALQDEHSKFYLLLKKEAHSIAKHEVDEVFQDEADNQSLTHAFNGFMGLSPDQLKTKMQTLMMFGDSVLVKWPQLRSNHEYINDLRKSASNKNQFRIFGENEPDEVITTDGIKREIYFGKPEIKERKELYYYRNRNDEAIALPFLSK